MLSVAIDVDKRGTIREKDEGDGEYREVFFGRLVRSLAVADLECADHQLNLLRSRKALRVV